MSGDPAVLARLYAGYDAFKSYATPTLKPKHIRRFDREFWDPAAARPEMAMLELGCGQGLFLAYLRHKGVRTLRGLDHDPRLAEVIPAAVRDAFRAGDALAWLKAGAEGERFDRVALLDVLEHFDAAGALDLLDALARVLNPGARVAIRVPNAASPLGAQFQHGDLTHRTAFTPSSLGQLAAAAGFRLLSTRPHHLGSPARRLTQGLVTGLLDLLLATPPPIWTANFIAVLEHGAAGETAR